MLICNIQQQRSNIGCARGSSAEHEFVLWRVQFEFREKSVSSRAQRQYLQLKNVHFMFTSTKHLPIITNEEKVGKYVISKCFEENFSNLNTFMK